MDKIKIGNNFNLIYACTIKDAYGVGQPIIFSHATDVSVSVELSNSNMQTEFPYTIDGDKIIVSVESGILGRSGVYRLNVDFVYIGNTFSRNPKAFELVNNVEQEGDCHPCGCDNTCPSAINDEVSIRVVKIYESVQSDWDVDNPNDPRYINNKPTKLSQFENDLDVPTMEEVEAAISVAVEAEAEMRTSADGALAAAITAEREARQQDVAGLSEGIVNEGQARRDADDTEREAREAGDAALQALIESLHSKAVIVDSVPTYADLLAVDTTGLAENSLYVVLKDETQGDITTIYDWNGTEWVFSGTFTVDMVANLVKFTPAAGINSTNIQDAIVEVFGKVLKLSSVATQVVDSDVALAFNCELLGTLEDGTQHVIASYKLYNAGTPEEQIVLESGSMTAHYNTNGIDRPTHETPAGKKDYAFLDDISGEVSYLIDADTSYKIRELVDRYVSEDIPTGDDILAAFGTLDNYVNIARAIANNKGIVFTDGQAEDIGSYQMLNPALESNALVNPVDPEYSTEQAYAWIVNNTYYKVGFRYQFGEFNFGFVDIYKRDMQDIGLSGVTEVPEYILAMADFVADQLGYAVTIEDNTIGINTLVTVNPNNDTYKQWLAAVPYPEGDHIIGVGYKLYFEKMPEVDLDINYSKTETV